MICRLGRARWLLACGLALAFSPLLAHADCFEAAGKKYAIDPLMLRAIAAVESSMNSRALHHNGNGSEDVGLMQINSMHFPYLAQRGITRARLKKDACLSVMVGAEILAGFIARFGYTWRAVGAYNAGGGQAREGLRERYAARVVRRYRSLVLHAAAVRMEGRGRPKRGVSHASLCPHPD
ncbi:transglycosylase-like protein with SLT domain [Herbaspirillum sp. SJZ130]|nr:transglycosylase-like protein with SLT domain [Herbaspirillum sp. SJZ130]TQK14366.1 transglycosylase-like protein with SLT domain [Herbaspirillum sp. SJZ106]